MNTDISLRLPQHDAALLPQTRTPAARPAEEHSLSGLMHHIQKARALAEQQLKALEVFFSPDTARLTEQKQPLREYLRQQSAKLERSLEQTPRAPETATLLRHLDGLRSEFSGQAPLDVVVDRQLRRLASLRESLKLVELKKRRLEYDIADVRVMQARGVSVPGYLELQYRRVEDIKHDIATKALTPEQRANAAAEAEWLSDNADALVHLSAATLEDVVAEKSARLAKLADELAPHSSPSAAAEVAAHTVDGHAVMVRDHPEINGRPATFAQIDDRNCGYYALNAALHAAGKPIMALDWYSAFREQLAARFGADLGFAMEHLSLDFAKTPGDNLSDANPDEMFHLIAQHGADHGFNMHPHLISDAPDLINRLLSGEIKEWLIPAAESIEKADSLLVLTRLGSDNHWHALVREHGDRWFHIDSLQAQNRPPVHAETGLNALGKHFNEMAERNTPIQAVIALAPKENAGSN